MEKDVRAFGISGDWEALSLQEDEWYNTVVEGAEVHGRVEDRRTSV